MSVSLTLVPEIRHMNEEQYRKAKKLTRSLCANCFEDNCLLLDDGYDFCICPQLISYSVLCKYFRAAVLPADKELYAEVMETDSRKRCRDCGLLFASEHPNTLYCNVCAANRARRSKRAWAARNRGTK